MRSTRRTTCRNHASVGPVTSLCLLLAGCGGAEPPPGGSVDPDLVGSWRLVEWTVGGGEPRCSQEEGGSSGQIMYTADGHMSAQLGCAGLSLEGLAEASGSEAVGRWSRRHFSYYGTYDVDPVARTVTHHVRGSSSSAWVGTDRVRNFTFETPDRVALTTVESENRLVWVRNPR